MGIVLFVMTLGFSMLVGASIVSIVRDLHPGEKVFELGAALALAGAISLLWVASAHLIADYGWLGGL